MMILSLYFQPNSCYTFTSMKNKDWSSTATPELADKALKALQQHGRLTVDQLAKVVGTHRLTIGRVMTFLIARGLAKRIPLKPPSNYPVAYEAGSLDKKSKK